MLTIEDGLPVEAVTEALNGAGLLALLQDDVQRAEALGDDLLARARAEAYPYGQFWALNQLGLVAEERDQFETAHSYYTQALALAPSVRNPLNHLAVALQKLGALALRTGDLDNAAHALGETLRLSHETGNGFHVARSATQLGRAFISRETFAVLQRWPARASSPTPTSETYRGSMQYWLTSPS